MPRQAIFVMTDSQRFDMLGCNQSPCAENGFGTRTDTPCLDALAAQGVRFQRAYTCQPVCAPARSALFTGTFPHSNGVWGNSMPLGDNVKTVGQRLRDKGVRCAYIGKWHLDGGDYFGLGRCPDGWDPEFWFDMRNYLEGMSQEDRVRSRHPDTNKDGIARAFTYGAQVTQRALRFMEKYKDEDFLLVVSYDEPHDPYLCPEPYASQFGGVRLASTHNFADDLAGKPAHQRAWAGMRLQAPVTQDAYGPSPYYFGCNAFIDSEIGRVVAAADEHAPDALLMYTSDHGEALGAHRLSSKGPAVYEEIVHIPFLARWRGHALPGSAPKSLCSHIDITPTLLDYFGVPAPKLMEGRSMLAELAGGAPTNERIFIEFGRYEIDHDGFGGFQPLRAVVEGPYKLCVNLLSGDELYDLEIDPGEMHNLIADSAYKTVRDRLHDLLLEHMNDTRDPFRGYCWERRPWRDNAREATWDYTLMTRQRENEEYEPRQLNYSDGLTMTQAVRRKNKV